MAARIVYRQERAWRIKHRLTTILRVCLWHYGPIVSDGQTYYPAPRSCVELNTYTFHAQQFFLKETQHTHVALSVSFLFTNEKSEKQCNSLLIAPRYHSKTYEIFKCLSLSSSILARMLLLMCLVSHLPCRHFEDHD